MFTVTNHTEPRSQSYNHYGNTSPINYNYTPIYNQTINESIEFNYPNSSNGKREKKMSKLEMEEMKRDVENLQSRMKCVMNNQTVPLARTAFSSLENSNINYFDNNFKQSQYLHNSNTTTFVPSVSLKSSIMASKIIQKDPFQERNVFQTSSINDIPSINKLVSRGNITTKHTISLNTQKDLQQSVTKQSYAHFDKEIAYQKEVIELRSRITSVEFQRDNLQRTLDRAEKRLQARDQQIIKMKQRMYILEQAKHQIDEKEKTWKNTVTKLQKQLVEAKLFKSDPNFEAIFQEKANQTNTLRQQLRRKNEQVQYLQERVQQNNKKFEQMINSFNSQRMEMITKLKQTQRHSSTLLFEKEREIAMLKEQLENFKYNIALSKNNSQ